MLKSKDLTSPVFTEPKFPTVLFFACLFILIQHAHPRVLIYYV